MIVYIPLSIDVAVNTSAYGLLRFVLLFTSTCLTLLQNKSTRLIGGEEEKKSKKLCERWGKMTTAAAGVLTHLFDRSGVFTSARVAARFFFFKKSFGISLMI